MFEHGFGDGLPLVPPTRERVERMLLPVISGPRVCSDEYSRTARALVGSLAMGVAYIFRPHEQIGPSMLVINLGHAQVFRCDGWSKADLREAIMERVTVEARAPLEAGAAAAKFSHPSHIQITVAGSTAGKRTCICPGNVRRMDPEHMDCFTPVSERIETL